MEPQPYIQTENNELKVEFPACSVGLETAVRAGITASHPADPQITAVSAGIESYVDVRP